MQQNIDCQPAKTIMFVDPTPTTLCSISPDGSVVVPPRGQACLMDAANNTTAIIKQQQQHHHYTKNTCVPFAPVIIMAPPQIPVQRRYYAPHCDPVYPPMYTEHHHLPPCEAGGYRAAVVQHRVALLYCNPHQLPCEWEKRLREFMHCYVHVQQHQLPCSTWNIYLVCETVSHKVYAETIATRWCFSSYTISVIVLRNEEGYNANNHTPQIWMDHPLVCSVVSSVPEEQLFIVDWLRTCSGKYTHDPFRRQQHCFSQQNQGQKRWYS